MAREVIGENYFEIFVDAPLEVCEQRDIKGLYAKARRGEICNFTGISSPYENPQFPDIHIYTNELTIEESTHVVLREILSKLKMK
jgi:adenylylsulfate kinase-like enzyme